MIVNVHQAKTQLSKLLAAAAAGEQVIIARDGTPAAELVPLGAPVPQRVPGTLGDLLSIPPEFFHPLPPEELAGWDG